MTKATLQDILSALDRPTEQDNTEATRSFIVLPDTTYSPEQIASAISSFLSCKYIIVDLEWSMGERKKAGGNQMAWPWTPGAECFSISIAGRSTDGTIKSIALAWPQTSALVLTALRNLLSSVRSIYHNAMGDLIWLQGLGIIPRLGACTMILAYLIDETQPRSLAAVATKYGGMVSTWKQDTQRLYATRHEINWDELLLYNLTDVKATLLAFEGLRDYINASPRRDQILRVHDRILRPIIPILANAALQGVPIDTDLLAKERSACHTRRNEAVTLLSEIVGLPPVQAAKIASSSKQTQEFVKGALGINIENAQAETLLPHRSYPAIHAILKIKKENKFAEAYFDPWRILLMRQEDGALHSVYKPVGTDTGRFSTEAEIGSPVQLFPRNESKGTAAKYDREPVKFRQLIRARQGRVIVSADASQNRATNSGMVSP